MQINIQDINNGYIVTHNGNGKQTKNFASDIPGTASLLLDAAYQSPGPATTASIAAAKAAIAAIPAAVASDAVAKPTPAVASVVAKPAPAAPSALPRRPGSLVTSVGTDPASVKARDANPNAR